ncbi:MAG TPA: OsmC family protein [Gemmatimonadaceae bacterium]|nr:OsmC family protein [Gemmatimonadaceae bacterium]
MDMVIEFPGGSRVDAHVGPFTISTSQLPDVTAPSPFTLFLASIGTCAGYYVQEFCSKRGISTKGMRIMQRTHSDPAGLVVGIELEVELPPDFPEKYRASVARAAELCMVKKHLEAPPAISVTATAHAEAMDDAQDRSPSRVAHGESDMEATMSLIKKTTKAAVARGRDAAVRVGRVAASAAVAGAKAGAASAITAGVLEAEKRWKETSPATAKKRTRKRVVAAVAGAALLGAAGVAIARSRRKPD